MSLAVVTDLATRLAETQEWIVILCFLIVGLCWAIWWLCGRLASGCPHCPHCTNSREEEERRQRDLQEKYSAKTGLWKPPARAQSPEEVRERLFGRQVVGEEDVPPEPGASGDEDSGAGHDGTKDG